MGEGFSGWRVEAGEAAPCSGRFPLPLLPASPARPASEPARHRFGVALRLPAPVPRVITTAGSFPSPLVPRFHPSPCSGRHVSRPEPYSLPPRQSPFQKSSWGFGGFFQEAPNVFPAPCVPCVPCVPGTTRRRRNTFRVRRNRPRKRVPNRIPGRIPIRKADSGGSRRRTAARCRGGTSRPPLFPQPDSRDRAKAPWCGSS